MNIFIKHQRRDKGKKNLCFREKVIINFYAIPPILMIKLFYTFSFLKKLNKKPNLDLHYVMRVGL